MPTAEAHVPTDRARRYLGQVCRHAGQMGRMGHQTPIRRRGGQAPPTVEHADWSDTCGSIHFTEGQCTLRATPDTLTLRVDAADEDTLRRLQDGIGRRLETIGHRDHLTVHWQRPDSTPGLAPGDAPHGAPAPQTAAGKRRRSRLSTLGWVAAAALAIVVHLGLLGGALAASILGQWGVNALLAIILVKVIFVGVHVIGGRFAIRRGKTFPRRWKLRHSPPEHTPTTPPRDRTDGRDHHP